LRLSAPTTKTFTLGARALVAGIVLHQEWVGVSVDPDIVYWLTAGGGILLALGAIFNKI
jgi:hypothetical protein